MSLFQLKKVFTVVGPYPVIREELRARGWVERHWSSTAQRAHPCHGNEMACSDDGGLSDGETVFRGLYKLYKVSTLIYSHYLKISLY